MAAYSALHKELSGILYNEDPDGMGATGGAPDDESSPEVSKLIPRLQGRHDQEAVGAVVRRMFPQASEVLVNRVFDAWERYLKAVG